VGSQADLAAALARGGRTGRWIPLNNAGLDITSLSLAAAPAATHTVAGRGLHSSTSYLDLSRVRPASTRPRITST